MKIGKMYKKSLKDLLKGPMAIHDKRDVVRYRNLEKLGLVAGVGIRCVSLTKAGKLALVTGETKDQDLPVTPPPPALPVPVASFDYNAAGIWQAVSRINLADELLAYSRMIFEEDINVRF